MAEAYTSHTIARAVYIPADEAIRVSMEGDPSTSTILSTGQTSVGTTATQIAAANTSRVYGISVMNTGSAAVYIGNDSVTTSSGTPIYSQMAVILPTQDAIYGVVETGSITVAYMEI
jgi:hypothetical protein